MTVYDSIWDGPFILYHNWANILRYLAVSLDLLLKFIRVSLRINLVARFQINSVHSIAVLKWEIFTFHLFTTEIEPNYLISFLAKKRSENNMDRHF